MAIDERPYLTDRPKLSINNEIVEVRAIFEGTNLSTGRGQRIKPPQMGLDQAQVRKWEETALHDIEYHRRQFDQPYRSTVALANFIKSFLTITKGEALDVACGAGANIFHLSKMLGKFRWTGVDIAGEVLFPMSQPIFEKHNVDVNLVTGDYYQLTELFRTRRFDLVLSLQTLLIIPSYERALDQLLAMTRGWLFITALFTDFNVDAKVEVMDYSWPEGTQGPYYYNVWSLQRFRSHCEERGCKEFLSQDFEIDIDLPPPESKGFGTYTRTLADGSRLQFTGPVFQPWKFIAISMDK